jgi:hypothetical protein
MCHGEGSEETSEILRFPQNDRITGNQNDIITGNQLNTLLFPQLQTINFKTTFSPHYYYLPQQSIAFLQG